MALLAALSTPMLGRTGIEPVEMSSSAGISIVDEQAPSVVAPKPTRTTRRVTEEALGPRADLARQRDTCTPYRHVFAAIFSQTWLKKTERGCGGEPEMDARRWFRKRRLTDALTVLDEPYVHAFFRANIHHLVGRDRDLVLDTGMGLARLSDALDLTPGKPVIALATHIHVDHVGSLHEFAERAGPDYSARSFETMDDGKTYADQFRALDEPVAEAPHEQWNAAAYRLTPARLTTRLFEGDVVDLGDRRFRVLHLPGHSPDSIGLLDEADGLFFSGDAIYDDQLVDDLPDSDPSVYRETMARIMELPVGIVHGGHGEPFDAERMERIARDYIWKGEA